MKAGDGESDHYCWERAEDMTTARLGYKLDPEHLRGSYDDAIPSAAKFYTSSGYSDEPLWIAAWLYRATVEEYYLKYIVDNAVSLGGTGCAVREFSWDNKMMEFKFSKQRCLASRAQYYTRNLTNIRNVTISVFHVGFESWYKRIEPNPNILYRALAGGPNDKDEFFDDRSNYEQTEATTSGTAPLVGPFCKLQAVSGNSGYHQGLPKLYHKPPQA
ncbi:endoglucanase 5 [Olea europaea subsp. europaea]|uniref:cellulase n=1 Tax=Olea europaea subsp. europaea TaxID=158383 RepID=A0A8S0Q5M1_OLEEU|nr:endoglucanase 5 [Olea europaea subsp. europaea]